MADASGARPGASVWRPVLVLAPGQLVSWGTLYYGVTFLAEPIHHDTGWALSSIFGAFSAGLVLAAVLTPLVGEGITRLGARCCLTAGSVLAAIALVVIALSPSLPVFWTGWLLAGAAMAATLYEAAFAALRETSGEAFRSNVSALTIIGGLASTVAWPASAWLVAVTDWRTVFLVFAALHLCTAVPLHVLLPERAGLSRRLAAGAGDQALNPEANGLPLAALLFAAAFTLAAVLSGAVSAHIALLLSAREVEPDLALLAASLIGPMQVLGRLADLVLHRLIATRSLGLLALCAPGLAVAGLLAAGTAAWLVPAFAVLYGLGQGLITIIRAMVPTLLARPANYARTNGWLAAPPLLGRALAPVAVATVIESAGAHAALVTLTIIGLLSAVLFLAASTFIRTSSGDA